MLTRRQREILDIMAQYPHDDRGCLVYETGSGGYLGTTRIAPRTVFALLRLCAISCSSGKPGELERYIINETGRNLLAAEVKS